MFFVPVKLELAVTARFRVRVSPDLTAEVPLPAIVHWLLDSVPEPGVSEPEAPVPESFLR